MKKTLVAIAAIAASAGAFAQTSVTAFGIVDIGVGVQKDVSNTGVVTRETTGVKDGALAGNRLGFRGTEDLGNGNTANFWLETGISPSTGYLMTERDGASGHVQATRTNQTTRQSWVGLKSNTLGEVRLGFQNSLNYDLTSQRHALSIYPETRGGEAHNYVSATGARNTAVTYFSPIISNIEFSAQVAAASDTTAGAAANTYSSAAGGDYAAKILALGAIYKNGPLKVGFVSTQYTVTGANPYATASVFATTTDNSATTNAAERKITSNHIAARYDFGMFEVAANYGTGKVQGATTALADSQDREQAELGIKVPMGKTDLVASYGTAKNKAATVAAGKTDITYVGVGVIHNLSKRTRLYALLGQQKDAAPTAWNTAAELTGTRIGVSHAF